MKRSVFKGVLAARTNRIFFWQQRHYADPPERPSYQPHTTEGVISGIKSEQTSRFSVIVRIPIGTPKLWPFSGTSAKLVTEPLQNQRCARNSFPILSPCLLLPSHAVFGQVFNHNLRRTDPSERRSFGSVVKPRRRARAHHPQAREILGGPPHQAVRFLRVCSPKTSCPRPISVGPSFF